MTNYRHHNLTNEETKAIREIRECYNGEAYTYHKLEALTLRLQKVKKIGTEAK
jgi:hypothetical protein